EYPSRYNADISRRHRWIRGDWQVAPWLLPRVPGADARWIENPLSGLSRWKLFDNLRRSLVPAALMLVLLGDWFQAVPVSGFGLVLVALVMLLPAGLTLLSEALRKPREWPLRVHLRAVAASAGRQAGQLGLSLAFLPYDAWVSLDAVVRTLVRLLVTHRHLLEWQTSFEAERNARSDLPGFFRSMWIAPTVALVTALALLRWQPGQLGSAAPFLALWLSSPLLAWQISQPLQRTRSELTDGQQRFLRRTARRTWNFFETLVTAEEHWLPPDNIQEIPQPIVAHRTSPTNMGLALLANLAARDFGYLSLGRLVQRTADALDSMEKLDRYRGHFYNWYDTRSRLPLPPLYVSTVDSGNLAGHLLTLSSGLLQICNQSPCQAAVFSGLRDTLEVAREADGNHSQWVPLFALLDSAPWTAAETAERLDRLVQQATSPGDIRMSGSPEAQEWLERFQAECQEHALELKELLPGLERSDAAFVLGDRKPPGRFATLRELAREAETSEVAEDLSAARRARELVGQLEHLARRCERLAEADYRFLYDPDRELFTIGYNVSDRRHDASFYDLLASESRLASFVAIAQGQIPQEHWFALGRLLGDVNGEPALISWSGSMFEYMMPLLVMPTYENTLLDRTCRTVVEAQIRYGRSRGVPWGMSESGYHAMDSQLNYQYRAFGVPTLGFKRGLADDLVIAPYASLMALMVAPQAACENLGVLAAEGRTGRFGFYEAVDYTASRLPADQTSVTIRSFMAHHQGMSLLALAYSLLDRPMQRRFLAHPSFRATELLLQERMPRTLISIPSDSGHLMPAPAADPGGAMRVFKTPHTAHPEVHLLSNGRYHVMISQAGGGYSRWGDMAVTRWREDPTRDCWGSFCYVQDIAGRQVWSSAFQPIQRLGERYEAIFTQGRAEFRQRFGDLELHTEIGVSPEDDVELRRLTLTNHGPVGRTLEITTYAEVVLATPASDEAHPAFSNLFVQTEYDPTREALLCTRRPRSDGEKSPWLVHVLNGDSSAVGQVSYETDRARFLGRGRAPNAPAALQGPLSGTTGPVLDPVISLRRAVRLAADASVRLDQITGLASDRAAALALAEKYSQPQMADRLFDLAWTHAQVTLRQLDCTPADAQRFGALAGALVQANPVRRASASIQLANRRGQSGLWSYGISADHPILLLQLSDPNRMDLVQSAIRAHAYWRINGLIVELLILHEDTSVYRQSFQDQIVGYILAGLEMPQLDKPGGIFVRRLDQLPPEDRLLLQAAARVVLSDEQGTFAEQVKFGRTSEPLPPLLEPRRSRAP
ncbi:MAG: cyclic beta 1-2 glucan synthetase, partial [Verrucomicrobiae bacterium]|nr:cyclic beta 1-2 glucan synthetase [Verrucomicrobiae bacterium]